MKDAAVFPVGVKQLIVIAGPSCCGKTTLLNQLFHGQFREIWSVIGDGEISQWQLYGHQNLSDFSLIQHAQVGGGGEKLIVHFDTFRMRPTWQQQIEAKLKDLHQIGTDPVLVTLWISSRPLLGRLVKRELRRMVKMLIRLELKDLYWRIRRFQAAFSLYQNPSRLQTFYRKWFQLCDGVGFKYHWVIDVSGNHPRIYSKNEWGTPQWSQLKSIEHVPG